MIPHSAVLMIMAVLFVGVLYLVKFLSRNKAKQSFMPKYHIPITVAAILVPIIVGVVLVQASVKPTVYNSKAVKKAKIIPIDSMTPIDPPEPKLKMVINDGSLEADIRILNHCTTNEVTVIKKGSVLCIQHTSAQVRAWMSDTKLQELEHIRKYIKQQSALAPDRFVLPMRPGKPPQPAMQGFGGFFAPVDAMQPTVSKQDTLKTKQLPFKHKYAEIFYFLALVLGVLGKYYWDYAEDKKANNNVAFEPHVIVMSFIIAALIYYSIQQGIEKKAHQLTISGVMFAFNNGFMWQTILRSSSKRFIKVEQEEPVEDANGSS